MPTGTGLPTDCGQGGNLYPRQRQTHGHHAEGQGLSFQVKLYYKAYNDIDMIETWSEISHTEKKTVVLKRFDSGHFLIRRGDVWISHLHGSWASETHVTTEPLTPGIKMIET